MATREAPDTVEGWYALHDFRAIDWDAWRDAPERVREQALAEGVAFLDAHEDVTDAEAGASAVFTVLGHKADLVMVHFRPTMADLDTAERAFEGTAFADFTERTTSYVSVTEVGGYTSDMAKDPADIDDAGLARYVDSKLHPSFPDSEFVCFYPMNKRRLPDENWYDLPIEERAELISSHGEIGKSYAGKVVQVITGSISLDDWEWGVTLFGDDVTQFKELLYEMRFDASSSRYAEFGPFYVGRRFPPHDLGAVLAGEPVPTGEDAHAHADATHGGAAHADSAHGASSGAAHGQDHGHGQDGGEDVRDALADLDIYAGKPHGEDVHAMVLYSEADVDDLVPEVEGLRGNFEHYDTHVKTAVYDDGSGTTAIVSIWETQSAAETAGGFLSELPGVVGRPHEADSTFGTMGMFYTVKPEHRGDFVEKFETVGELLDGMDGHLESSLLANVDDENDMFIASQWESKDDAMSFFRSDAFSDTVSWGRDILADRPRHVFLS